MREFKDAIAPSSKEEPEPPELESRADSSEKAAAERPANRSRTRASS
jgi:hypothetical protein